MIKFTSDSLNLIIAVCAILISAASFYATFLQADSAERQVRAMTMPLIQFEHNNYDPSQNQRSITLILKNAGIGPAIVRDIDLVYENSPHKVVGRLFKQCCGAEYEEYESALEQKALLKEIDVFDGGIITRPLKDTVIPGQSDYTFLQVYPSESSNVFWDKLNQERFKIAIEICYCSLLDDCFKSDINQNITEVESCNAIGG